MKIVHSSVVVSAEALAYGSKEIVRKEIHRLLKPGGASDNCRTLFNNNILYIVNRYLRYLLGNRSKGKYFKKYVQI